MIKPAQHIGVKSKHKARTRFKMMVLQGTALLCVSTLATGCASTATGQSQSRFNALSAAPQPLTAQAPKGTVMAVVRYPAFIETSAQDLYYESFGRKAIGGTVDGYDAASPDLRVVADNMILKSNYFALSLFKELAERLPEHSVLLSPHAIKLDENGNLTSEPMTQAESLANIVSVDFSAYSFPDVKKMMSANALSFGDLVTPLVTVRTDHRASAATQGVLLTSRPLIRGAVANGRKSRAQDLVAIQSGSLVSAPPELDFISFLNETAPVNVAIETLSPRISDNTLMVAPLEKIRLDGELIETIDSADAGAIDPLEDKFSAGFANQVMAIINQTDINKASMVGRAGAISQFDENLAALTLIGSDQADYQARARYAERLLEAEQKYLSVQSLRLFDGVHNGEMGAQIREMLKAEYEVLEKRRDLARQQNVATGLAILATVAAGAAISNGAGSAGNGIAQQIAVQALISGALYAGTQAFSFSRRSNAVGSSYLNSIAPALDEQVSVQLDLIDSNETITAIRFEDLRAKLQDLYTDRQRALDVIATRCGYSHEGTAKSGTWMGVCENGLANGAGVGVLRNADGSAYEYYGYAENGQPQGAGFMIVHGLEGSYALEGRFDQGQANGVMRVSKSGKDDRLRLYQAGQDIGSAPSGQSPISPFDNLGRDLQDSIAPIALMNQARLVLSP